MNLPPIFAYIIFFTLDFIALVFYMLGITGPVGAFMTTLTTALYAGWVFNRYGFTKGKEKLFKYKNIPRKRLIKKLTKIFGGSLIPFITVWAVYDDYKEEKSGNQAEGGEAKEESKKSKLLKGAALAAATVATGGTAGAAVAGGKAVAGAAAKTAASRAATGAAAKTTTSRATTGAATRTSAERVVTRSTTEVSSSTTTKSGIDSLAKNADGSNKREINPWIKMNKPNIKSGTDKKTIFEEVSGIKTGLKNPEDYRADLPDFSRPETYSKLAQEREEQKKKDEKKRKDIEDTRLIQRQREKIEAEKVFDRSFIRRFGTKAYERMIRDRELRKGKNPENIKNEEDDK